jgi:hypothetical protein
MGTFSASLRAVGDVTALPATVEISEGRLTISAGSSEIGSWSLDEVSLEEIPTGYRLVAEGDQILIELKDVKTFSTALVTGAKKRRRRTTKSDGHISASPVARMPTPKRARVTNAAPSKPKPNTGKSDVLREKWAKPKAIGSGIAGAVDTLLIKTKKRYGAYLPDFVFSRAMFFIVLATLVAMVVFPVVFSMLFVIAGALIIMFGAIVYTDSVLASRFLPGRSTPQQALILGISVLLFGVLLGAIAR